MEIILQRVRDYSWIGFLVIPLAVFLLINPHYLVTNTFFWLCLLTLPISLIRDERHRFPFFMGCLILGIMGFFLPTTIGILLFVGCMMFFVADRVLGGIHVIGLFHAFLASPFFIYISSLISFPLRIQLAKIVANLLTLSGMKSEARGSVLYLEGSEFLVDEACSGMYLLGYGLLFGIIILSQRIRKRPMSFWKLSGFFALLYGLILWGNIVRIYLLAVGNIKMDNWMHEGVGLILFIVQILLPFYFAVNWKSVKEKSNLFENSFNRIPRLKYLSLCAILTFLFVRTQSKNSNSNLEEIQPLQGYTFEKVDEDVLKQSNKKTLIYFKKPVPGYSAHHNPMICWKGSGYAFNKIERLPIEGVEINFAELNQDSDRLYTAWWFQSKTKSTANQLEWRKLNLLKGDQFYLVNVTCNTKEDLASELEKLMRLELFH